MCAARAFTERLIGPESGNGDLMERLKRWLRRLDSTFEYLGIGFLAAMVLVVTWQVFSRAIFDAEPPWSEQVSIVLMIWLVFLGIAIGFRERSHAAVSMFVERLPEGVQRWVQGLNYALVFAFGVYLIVRGLQLTFQANQSAFYVAMPISGFMVCVYVVLQTLGIRTQERRDGEVTEEPAERLAE